MSSNKPTKLENKCLLCGSSLNEDKTCLECGWNQLNSVESDSVESNSIESESSSTSKSFQFHLKKPLHSQKFSLKNLMDPTLITQIVVIILLCGYVGLFFDIINLLFASINNSILLIKAIIGNTFNLRFLFWTLGHLLGLGCGIYLFLQPFLKNLFTQIRNNTLDEYFIFMKLFSFGVPFLLIISSILLIIGIPGFNFSLILFIIASFMITILKSSKNNLNLQRIINETNYVNIANLFAYLAVILLGFEIFTNSYRLIVNIFYKIINLGFTWRTIIWDFIYIVLILVLIILYFIPFILKPIQARNWQAITDQKIIIKKFWIPIPLIFLIGLYILDYDAGWHFIFMIVMLVMVYYRSEILV